MTTVFRCGPAEGAFELAAFFFVTIRFSSSVNASVTPAPDFADVKWCVPLTDDV